jgi:macrolide transport system ATP-binding/permease protein
MPDWQQIVRNRISSLNLAATTESELVEELAHHLDDLYRDLQSRGFSEQEALQRGLSELEDLYPLKSSSARVRHMPKHEPIPVGEPREIAPGLNHFLEALWRDLRYSVRLMRKTPLFVVFVVLTLGFGIGANTTVFTVINTLILNPLPVPNSSRLMAVGMRKLQSAATKASPQPLSYPDLKDYQARNQTFHSLAGYTGSRPMVWQQGASSTGIFGELVTGNYFTTLGLTPAAGRFFLPDEESSSGAHGVAVMNYATWQSRFGGSADVLGKTLLVNRVPLVVVGIAPPRFLGINAIFGPDLWIPLGMAEQLFPNEMKGLVADRNKALFQAIGLLNPGIELARAQANMTTLAAELSRAYPATHEGFGVMVAPVRDILLATNGTSSSQMLAASFGLLLVVAVVLLIACSNVANLLIARSAARKQEMAVRLAVGASRQTLVRQLLTESVLLGLLGGGLGIVIGYGSLHLLFRALPSAANFVTPKLDTTVFAFALAVSLVTSFIFGTAPALSTSRDAVSATLKEESRTAGRSRRKVTMANLLLVGQVAFSFLMLVVATLFLRGIERAYRIDPGFQTAHLSVFFTNPQQVGYGKSQIKAFAKQVRGKVAALPGVESVSWSSNMPLWARGESGLRVEGHQGRSQADTIATIVNTVDTNYFETAGITIARGRPFTGLDQEQSAPVAVVNEKLAHEFWADTNPIGKRIQLPGENQMRQIVGVSRNANYTSWGESPQLCVYVPLEQNVGGVMALYVRSSADPGNMIVPVEREMHAIAPDVLVANPRTGRQIIDGGLFGPRIGVGLLGVFGLLALCLASIGLYGILAYSVNQRRHEIGLRMALGAARLSIFRLIVKQGMSLVVIGILIGLTAALLIGRLLSSMLYGISPGDPLSLAGAILLLSVVALLACYMPARRASHVDPLEALREG